MNRAVFLDLNGTLVLPIKVENLGELTLVSGGGEAVARLCQAGFICPVVTVQSGIAKGVFSELEFVNWFNEFPRKWKLTGHDSKGLMFVRTGLAIRVGAKSRIYCCTNKRLQITKSILNNPLSSVIAHPMSARRIASEVKVAW